MSEPLSVMFQQEREHLSQLQNRLLTVNYLSKMFSIKSCMFRVRLIVLQLMFTKN
jgi:hypothetical protein